MLLDQPDFVFFYFFVVFFITRFPVGDAHAASIRSSLLGEFEVSTNCCQCKFVVFCCFFGHKNEAEGLVALDRRNPRTI